MWKLSREEKLNLCTRKCWGCSIKAVKIFTENYVVFAILKSSALMIYDGH